MVAVIGDSRNHASITLHRNAGFTFCGTIHSVGYKFGRWLDSVIMELPLGEGDRSTPREVAGLAAEPTVKRQPAARHSFQHGEHPGEVVPALHDEAGCRHHAVGALRRACRGTFLDAVEGDLARVAEHRENRLLGAEIERIVAPLAGRHPPAVKPQDLLELPATK